MSQISLGLGVGAYIDVAACSKVARLLKNVDYTAIFYSDNTNLCLMSKFRQARKARFSSFFNTKKVTKSHILVYRHLKSHI
jgi:hypothetical protein